MSFHAAGGNVGDTCKIPLPKWVLHVGEGNPDIFYTDRKRVRNKEYISLGCDDLPLFWGRTPVQMYCDFTQAFVDAFSPMFGAARLSSRTSAVRIGQVMLGMPTAASHQQQMPGMARQWCGHKL